MKKNVLGTFSRRARSLATCFCFARMRILAERFLFHRTQFPMKQEDGQAEKERHTFLHTAQTSDCPHVHKQSP